mmetsp:Transcript_16344/g.28656  ORF Transcript_16344/g.28656 Transcript_16344/m.28656 type:complete len:438 (+) Transcript_16344:53-1366(+)
MAAKSLALFALAAVARASFPDGLKAELGKIAEEESRKYNCSISIAVRKDDESVAAAAGTVDFLTNRQAQPSDRYAWGSVTKMFTAASIMKLVSLGRLSLDDHIGPLVDPILAKMAAKDATQNFSSVEDLWGKHVAENTVRQLLAMQSAIPDFDTATPSRTGISQDPLRAELYNEPDKFWTPQALMSVPWVVGHEKDCRPFPSMPLMKFCYSSTNFMILGLVLAAQAGESTWSDFNQSAHLPVYLRERIIFANGGAPKDYGTANGYDRTSYNRPHGQTANHDNAEVKGVFAGWTASNLVADAAAVADLTWEIWGPTSSVAPKEYIDEMIPKTNAIYGLGAFNIGFQTGQKGPLGMGYGHLGATYGYQSLAGYFPELNFALTIGTNIETDTQVQPADTFCLAYNAVAGALLHKTFTCRFEAHGYYGGGCVCSEDAEIMV